MSLAAGLLALATTGDSSLGQVPKANAAKKKTVKKGASKAVSDDAEPKKAMTADAAAPTAGGIKFARDIAPILSANCARCHTATHRSGFNQTTFEGLMKGGKAGNDVVPGSPEESRLVLRIKGEETPKMPPGNAALSEGAIARIEQWIKEGARLDAGLSATDPIAKYAATPEDLRKTELAKLSPDERDKRTEAAARERLKRADPKANPEMTASPHFLLFAEMPKERATALLKTMETQFARVSRLLSGGGGRGLNLGEKVGLYVFKEQKGYTEFVRTIENQEVDPGDSARAKLGAESPYILAIDPLAGGAEPAGSATTRKTGRSKKDDSFGGPERTLAGLLTEQLAAGSLAQAGKPPRWVTMGVGALLASGLEPKSPYYRRLRAEALEQCKQGWPTKANEALGDATKPETVRAVGFAIAEWLASANAPAFPNFIQGMLEGGNKLDETIGACLNGNREQFLQASGAWVEHYAGRR